MRNILSLIVIVSTLSLDAMDSASIKDYKALSPQQLLQEFKNVGPHNEAALCAAFTDEVEKPLRYCIMPKAWHCNYGLRVPDVISSTDSISPIAFCYQDENDENHDYVVPIECGSMEPAHKGRVALKEFGFVNSNRRVPPVFVVQKNALVAKTVTLFGSSQFVCFDIKTGECSVLFKVPTWDKRTFDAFPNGDLLFSDEDHLYVSTLEKLKSEGEKGLTKIYTRDNAISFLVAAGFKPLHVFSDTCIAEVMGEKSFTLFEKIAEAWKAVHSIETQHKLANVTWAPTRKIAVSQAKNGVTFHRLDDAKGGNVSFIEMEDLFFGQCAFMHDGNSLACGLNSSPLSVKIIDCRDITKPTIVSWISFGGDWYKKNCINILWETPRDAVLQLQAIKNGFLIRTKCVRSWGTGEKNYFIKYNPEEIELLTKACALKKSLETNNNNAQ